MKQLVVCLLCACAGIAWLCPADAAAAEREEAQYNVVVSLYNAGKWEAALQKISEREKQKLSDEMKARYLFVRGLAHEKGGQTDAAANAYSALLQQHPNAPDAAKARVALAFIEYARGQHDRVIALFAAINLGAVDAADRPTLALMNAESLRAKGDHARAKAAYEVALKHGANRNAVAPRLFDLALRVNDPAQILAASSGGVPGIDANLVALARAESHLRLKQYPQAVAEAGKVQAESGHSPRAQYVVAQALVAQGKLADAVTPLQNAIAKMDKPAAPPAARLTLVECLLSADRTDDAAAALREARTAIAARPAAEQQALSPQLAMLEFKSAVASKDDKALIDAAARVRQAVDAGELPKVAMLRLQAMERVNDWAGIVKAAGEDEAALRKSEFDASSTMILHRALTALKRDQDASNALAELIQRKPDAPESLAARLTLANVFLAQSDKAKARAHLDAVLSHKDARKVLGDASMDRAALNAGLLALEAGEHDAAIAALKTASAQRVEQATRADALVLLGQAHAGKSQFSEAAASWNQAIEIVAKDKAPDLMDRIARARLRTGDHAGAHAMWTAMADAIGGTDKLPADALHAWAGVLYAMKKFDDAAARYAALYEQHGKDPSRAYECAASFDAAGKPADAATWYATAAEQRDRLPQAYASSLELMLANARLRSGTGDLGLAYWVTQLAPDSEPAAFDRAAYAVVAILDASKHAKSTAESLAASLAAFKPDQPRYYAVGALCVAAHEADAKHDAAAKQAESLLADWVKHESTFEGSTFSTTLAPAMIEFYAGEADRRARRHDDALVHYETVLAVYPYNQWVDAASLGAARCYAQAGDTATARSRLEQIVNAKNPPAGAERFRKQAQQLLEELSKGP